MSTQTALVWGAAGGIGRALADRLVADKWSGFRLPPSEWRMLRSVFLRPCRQQFSGTFDLRGKIVILPTLCSERDR
jgi:hypothetical protein